MNLKLSPHLLQQLNRLPWKKSVGVYIDGNLTIFGSQNEFIAKMKNKTFNKVRSHCMTHQEALSFSYCHES